MRRYTSGIFLIMLAFSSHANGADIDALKAGCEDCHGLGGISSHEDVPIIAGQTPEFLSRTLRAFQRWDRPCVKSTYRHGDTSRKETDMCRVAGKLGEAEIAALATYYSQQPFLPARQEYDSELAAAGAGLHEQFCEKCHENGGKTAGRGPRIAGQWMHYFKATLKFVPTGEHLVPPLMERSVTDLGTEDIEKLAHFYASQQD